MSHYRRYRGWESLRRDSQKRIKVNRGIANLVRDTDNGDLFIDYFSADTRFLYNFVLKRYGEIYDPDKD